MSASSPFRPSNLFIALAGACLGFVLNYAAFVAIGRGHPVEPTTFVAVAGGAFAALRLSDRFGDGERRPIVVASVVTVVLVLLGAFIATR